MKNKDFIKIQTYKKTLRTTMLYPYANNKLNADCYNSVKGLFSFITVIYFHRDNKINATITAKENKIPTQEL